MRPWKYLLPACSIALVFCAPLYATTDHPAATPRTTRQGNSLPALSVEQQRAVGIIIAEAAAVTMPRRTEAYGRVLDPSQLVADAGRLDSSRAAAKAAAAETARLQGLYRRADTSLKALQVAEAARIQAQARARLAEARFVLRWGPLARLGRAPRAHLIRQLAAGRQLLLRADLPGRHSLGTLPKEALVDVDGIRVPARVLGPLPQAAARVQSVGLLLQIPHPPAGLGPGAELPVVLEGRGREGQVVPDGALIYGTQGVYVYSALADKSQDGDTRFAPLAVTVLQPIGHGWLVAGLHPNDRIVVQGAGVLWSLQGLGAASGDD
jgi:hypothetical protein